MLIFFVLYFICNLIHSTITNYTFYNVFSAVKSIFSEKILIKYCYTKIEIYITSTFYYGRVFIRMNTKTDTLKVLICFMFFFTFFNNFAYMASKNEDEIIKQAEAIHQEKSDTFLLKEIIIDSDFDGFVEGLNSTVINKYINQRVSIKDLQKLSREITQAYRKDGYLSAIAYAPGQEIFDGKVTIKVTSGKFGEIVIDNQSHLDTEILNSLKSLIKIGSPVEGKYIENLLYRINALGGVKATGQLEKMGDSTDIRLAITVTDDKKTRDIVYTENHGSEHSGRYRLGVIHNSYNIDNKGSNLEIGGMFSNKNLRNYHIDYSVLSNKKTGSRAGISISRTTYDLAKEYDALDADGAYNDFTVYGKSTAFQTHRNGMNFSYGYRYRKISDDIGAYNLSSDKNSHAIYGEASGYHRTPKGIVNYSLKLTLGKLNNKSDYANFLNKYNHTEGSFIKANGKVDYIEPLNKDWHFRSTLSWQQANRHLDGSEKFNIGGVYGVRGYSSGDGSGDQGILSRTELIYQTKLKGLSVNAFYDIGGVGNKGKSLNTMQSYGIGLNYQKTNDFFASFIYARKIGFNENVSSDKGKSKIWFMVGKVF